MIRHELTEALKAAGRIALIVHIAPDGDTCGSALALCRALVLMGKHVTVLCDDPVPKLYVHLEGADKVVTPGQAEGAIFDLAVAVDVGDLSRMGKSRAVFEGAKRTAQVDHHATNPGYAQINLTRSPLSATAVLVMEVIDSLGVPLDGKMAECLYVAAATDTGNFKQRNTDVAAARLASRCMEAGLDLQDITRRLFDLRPLSQSRLLGRALLNMTMHAGGKIAVMRLSKADFEETGALAEHTEGIVNFALNTAGVEIACLMAQPGDRVKCSFRSLPPHDVSRAAALFGGGGHSQAAGCVMPPPMETACARVVEALTNALEQNA
ncbi:MAG: bifunctional oligoribonuclease/PAP phosphatase NrnA [Firmicutes bacterium]|nr:bifunctional oligoribonuclease/PAP phosphatase NrnA [Bacillota bacterium]